MMGSMVFNIKKNKLINGQKIRPEKGKCPSCKKKQNEWCDSKCDRIDPIDYR